MTRKRLRPDRNATCGAGKHPLIRAATKTLPEDSEAVYAIVSKGDGPPITGQRLTAWLALYRHPKRFGRVMLTDILTAQGLGDIADEVAEPLYQFITLQGSTVKRLKSEIKALQRMSHEEQKEFYEALTLRGAVLLGTLTGEDTEPDDLPPQALAAMGQKTEWQFGARVFMPCLAQFKQTPFALFRKARAGDLDALCNLLSIDKAVAHDRVIAQWTWELSNKNPQRYRRTIGKAHHRAACVLDRRGAYESVIAFLSQGTAGMPEPLRFNWKDALGIYHAHHSTKTNQPGAIDPHFPVDEQSMRKAIQRAGKDLAWLRPENRVGQK